MIDNFHVKLDNLLHVLYDMYNVCVANLTDKFNYYGPHKHIIYIALPFIVHLSCNKVKRLIKSIVIKNQ